MSNEFMFEPTVYAYDLMNKPHDMGNAYRKAISQTVLQAIRANGDNKLKCHRPEQHWLPEECLQIAENTNICGHLEPAFDSIHPGKGGPGGVKADPVTDL